MRLSIRWIFDHICQKLSWQSFNIDDLIKLLNKSTSEIESIEHVKLDINKFTIVQILERSNCDIKAHSPELNSEFNLPERQDAAMGSYYLIKQDDQKNYNWATVEDFGSEKSYLVPAIKNHASWKNEIELEDYILVLDNKAISHRPDLWGHRGFAREVAALTGYNLKPIEDVVSGKKVEQYFVSSAHNGPFSIELKQPQNGSAICKRFSGLYISEIKNQPSDLFIASRLMRMDAKPIDFIVDATNYVMFDLGQPIHAYDADKINSKKIVIREGDGQTFPLLDDSEVTVDARDCVIYDGDQLETAQPIALGGIMGGKDSAVSAETQSLFLESGNFDASAIRHTSIRLKKRTEASARFEKSLDPNQNVNGILRFLAILDEYKIPYQASESVTSLGALVPERVIKVDSHIIKKLLSVEVEPQVISKILTKIGFGVEFDGSTYFVTVPTFRGTKDVTIPADIVEEIGRFIGYDIIDLELPSRVMSAFDIQSVQNIREIKKHLAYGLHMNEVQSYAFYDEEFLKELHYNPGQTVEVINPQSENWRRLVTSLVPNLIKVVDLNKQKQERFRFFELNRVWRLASSADAGNALNALEALELSGIIGEHKNELDFYACKNILESLFALLNLNIKWRKPELKDLGNKKLEPWYYSYETAELVFDNQVIGLAGMADARFLSKIVPEGKTFIFELNADFLINSRPEFKKFVPLEKYPEVHFDISVMMPSFITVHDVEKIIKGTKIPGDIKITKVCLLDFFEKEEWGNKKSLTFRIAVYDEHKTLVKAEIDQVYQHIVRALEKIGGTVR